MAYGMGNQPIIVLREGTERSKDKEAQYNNIAAARAVADAVRSTLGPKGMDKMLVDSMGDVIITNDGVTILKEIEIEHPAAKMVVEVAKTQDMECGDGTTTSVVLAGELLKRSEELIEQNIHPTVITNGFKLAASKAVEILNDIAIDVGDNDEILIRVASTAMTGKSVGGRKDMLSELAVKAVRAVADESGVDVDNIKVEKKIGGTIADTELVSGIVLDKERVHPRMPKKVKDAKIALISSGMEIKKTEVDAQINITDPTAMNAFLTEEENTLRKMVETLKEVGANVVFCQKGVDDLVQHYMAKNGMFCVRRVKQSDMEKLAKATGAKIVGNLHEIGPEDLGNAELVEERTVGDEEMTFVMGCKNPKAVSIIIRGGTEHVLDEVERSLHDAMRVAGISLEDGKVVPGGGAPEIELSMRLADYASSVGGREQLAIEAFAEAMEIIPWTLGENAGLDGIDVIISLKHAHEQKGGKVYGIDLSAGKAADMVALNVLEPLRVKTQAVASATEVANMILRIDDVIASRRAPPTDPMRDPNMGGMGPMGTPGGMM
ncbi:MAG: archaeal chaperonin [Candidatus Methanomethylophilaceae archaeon]|nr:archaeal chaperonin [Candidatus Methanomethylophilaceae archaeon]MDI3541948.1 archaeal chaperonin [Candidatus Methanomethylophilaceae archaeon]